MNGNHGYQAQEGYQDLDLLLARGRALHSRAVYEACARLIADCKTFLRGTFSLAGSGHKLKHP